MKRTAIIFAAVFGGAATGCAGVGDALADRTGAVRADGAESVRPGGHCESSALANALRGAGWDVEERDIIGGGGAPSFMFSADGFPFLGPRSARMRETFFAAAGISYRAVVPEGRNDVWRPVIALLEAGLPVPLRVDMRFLPYRYGGKFGPKYIEFGWHWITLYGIDFDAKTALVSDTEYPELQTIRLAHLDRARRSATKRWPPRAEYVALEPAGKDGKLDRTKLAAAGLAALRDNYEGKDLWTDAADGAASLPIPTGLAGIEAFPDAIRNFDRYAKPWVRAPALSFLAGCIERNGTGGAGFRLLFRDFLAAAADEGRDDSLALLLPPLDEAAAAWRGLAAEFDAAGAKRLSDEERTAAYGRCAEKAERVAAAERTVYEAVSASLGAAATR